MSKKLIANAVLLTVLLASTIGVAAAGSVKLAPHRAVYDMSLERSASGSGVVELSGRMVYELTGDACKGYSQNMRFVTRSIDRKGQPSIMDLRSKFWEDGLGQSFRFDTDQYRGERLAEAASGRARRGKNGDNVAVRVSKPKAKKFDLKRKVLFPIQHTVEILAAAQKGDTVFTSDLYDGSEKGTKIYATTAILGQKKTGAFNSALESVQNSNALDGLAAWPVSLSYFDASKVNSDALPSYELGFLFYENGVSRRLVIDYGHFAIRGKLTKLEMLKVSKCDK